MTRRTGIGNKQFEINSNKYIFTYTYGLDTNPMLFIGKMPYHDLIYYMQISIPKLFMINIYKEAV